MARAAATPRPSPTNIARSQLYALSTQIFAVGRPDDIELAKSLDRGRDRTARYQTCSSGGLRAASVCRATKASW
jgi:hypothetical protein